MGRCHGRDLHLDRAAGHGGLPHVPGHHHHAREVEQATGEADDVEGIGGLHALDEGVGERAVGIHRAPHQALHHAGDPHGGDVEHDADGGHPEVQLDRLDGVHLLAAEQARHEVVERAHRDQAHPAEGAGVHVAHGPVGVVAQGVHRLDGHHRALERGHAVERQRHDQEAQDGIVAQLVPCTRQGHDPVDHPAPAGGQQYQREHHAHGLGPVGQRGVVQVVGTRPHVGEDQRPEVHDRQAVAVHRAACLLRDEVVHHSQEAGREEEAHGVMAVPPLHHRVLHARIGRVALHPARGHFRAVDHVQQRHREDEAAEEPVGHVDVLHAALAHGAEEHDGVRHPHQRDQDVDRPLELGVFLARGVAQRQADGRGHDHGLPAPERERGEPAREQAHLPRALYHVIAGGEQRAAAEREDHRVGVQRAQAAVAEPGNAKVEFGPGELCGDDHADQHADHPPHHGHD